MMVFLILLRIVGVKCLLVGSSLVCGVIIMLGSCLIVVVIWLLLLVCNVIRFNGWVDELVCLVSSCGLLSVLLKGCSVFIIVCVVLKSLWLVWLVFSE